MKRSKTRKSGKSDASSKLATHVRAEGLAHVARILDVSHPTARSWADGTRMPSTAARRHVAAVFEDIPVSAWTTKAGAATPKTKSAEPPPELPPPVPPLAANASNVERAENEVARLNRDLELARASGRGDLAVARLSTAYTSAIRSLGALQGASASEATILRLPIVARVITLMGAVANEHAKAHGPEFLRMLVARLKRFVDGEE